MVGRGARNGVIPTSDVLLRALEAFQKPEALAAESASLVKRAQNATELVLERLEYDLSEIGMEETVGSAPIHTLRYLLERMYNHSDRYLEWVNLKYCIETLRTDNLDSLVEAIYKNEITPEKAAAEFSYACAEARWNYARSCLPEMVEELRTVFRHKLVDVFQELEKDRFKDVRQLILSRHFDKFASRLRRRDGHHPG